MITIYVLLENEQIRYIGRTTRVNLTERLKQHLLDAMLEPQKFQWIIDLCKKGKKPEIKAILSYREDEASHYESYFDLFLGKNNSLQGSATAITHERAGIYSPILDSCWISMN